MDKRLLKRLVLAILTLGILHLPSPSFAQEGILPSDKLFSPEDTRVPAISPLKIFPATEREKKAREMLRKRMEKKIPSKKPEERIRKEEEEPVMYVPVTLPPEEKPSAFESYIQGELPSEISTDIKQFGYDLFDKPPSTFAPVDTVPVGPDFLLGPGDELKIHIWGKVNEEYTKVIDRDGKIILPQMGPLYLAGLKFAEAKAYLEKEISRYYKRSEVKINISMGSLRSISVFVVGQARMPGRYTLSSLSTLINALFAAGGPGKSGTLRDIQVKRSGKTIVHFDMYDFLLKGDKTKDIKLMPEDVIFIPPVGPLVGIAGNVKNPAIYELKGETSLLQIIEMSGGFNDISFRDRIQINRILDNRRVDTFEFTLEDMEKKDIKIQPGDLVKIFPVIPDQRIVKLIGAVQVPGEYGFTPGMTVKSLISMGGGLKYYAYNKEAELTRITPTPKGPQTEKIVVNLEKILKSDSRHDVRLKENDYLFIRAVPEWELHRIVEISGEVKFPGAYTVEKGETLSSLIRRAGGYTDKAYLKGAVFTRESVKELQQRQLSESIDRLEQQILSQSAATIVAALSPGAALQEKAALEQRRALIAKMRAAEVKGRISIKLDTPDKFDDSPFNFVLEDADELVIPEKPAYVQVIGSVYNQTAFVYKERDVVSSYIKNAGGMTKDADKKGLYILKVDGTAISKREMRGLMSMRLDPGDTIVVPEKIEKIAWLREIKDITQILYQIAVTAGILIIAF